MNKEIAQKSFDEASNLFNWEKVHKAMVVFDWKWWGEDVPSIETMKETVRGLFIMLEEYEYKIGMAVETGGFSVSVDSDGEIEFISIKFVLSQAIGYVE